MTARAALGDGQGVGEAPPKWWTPLLSSRWSRKVTQERLGHASITTTLDLYSHVTATMQEDAAVKLDTVFRSAISGCGVDKGRL